MTLATYEAPDGADSAVATFLRDLGYLKPEPRGGRQPGFASPPHLGANAGFMEQGIGIGAPPSDGRLSSWAQSGTSVPPTTPATGGAVLSAPLMVRLVPGAALRKPHWFDEVKVVAWRYLVEDGPISADFMVDDGQPDRILTGPVVKHLVNAAYLAEQEYRQSETEYKVAILDVPMLQIEALTLEDGHNVRCIVYKSKRLLHPLKIEDSDSFARRLAEAFRRYAPAESQKVRLEDETNFMLPAMVAHG